VRSKEGVTSSPAVAVAVSMRDEALAELPKAQESSAVHARLGITIVIILGTSAHNTNGQGHGYWVNTITMGHRHKNHGRGVNNNNNNRGQMLHRHNTVRLFCYRSDDRGCRHYIVVNREVLVICVAPAD